MADEEKTTVEVAEGDEAKATKKGGSKLILFGGIGLGVIIIGVVLALFVLKPMMAGDSAKADSEQVEGSEDGASHGEASEEHYDDDDDEGEEESGGHGGGGDEAGNGLTAAIKEIVVNPAGTGGSRYLSVSLGFAFGSKKVRIRFEENELMVRDALISILSSKTVTQLTDAKQKEIMRYQIKKRLSKLLKTKKLKAVYYTDFVLQ